jgi:alanyl-tRNA synthetase
VRSAEIRERFLRFFEDRGHHRLPSASLIPRDDPSLLFTVAGMVPLKPYISGLRTPPSPRLVSCQKCFRGDVLTYDDIAEVGDTQHNTFFEMLGNWSIGDYFKETAIDYAWELVTGDWGLDPARLWPSIYPTDSESERIWAEKIGVPRERIAKLTDNWWAAGATGPCGYDSEIYWDWGGPCSCGRSACTPQDECGGDRWMEFWNLVFMEFDQHPDGSRPALPKPTVDTGMGFERMTAILQGVRSIYDTDLFRPLVDGFRRRASEASEPAAQRSLNVLADHLRGASFLIADGVLPSNEGRGYVLRRVIRRAAVHARRVVLSGGLADGVDDLAGVMGATYRELVDQRDLIVSTLRSEESAFQRTLESGVERFERLVERGSAAISGEEAFRLYDTFGLPVELTVEMAAERGIGVDVEGFRAALEEQRTRSRSALGQTGFSADAATLPETLFAGYEMTEADASVARIGSALERDMLREGETEIVLLDVSPFYAEAGGQVGDTGTLQWPGGAAQVVDTTYSPGGHARLHTVRVEKGELRAGTRVHAAVDEARRARIARHHSATHLLNQALRDVLGQGIVQRGSYVGPEHTTFDFSFPRQLAAEELSLVEQGVNAAIRRNLERSVEEMPLAVARASGAIALLDESYADLVRVVRFGDYSRELCGGTHVERSGDIGAALIASESSIGQGTRRIEMVAGEAAEQRWRTAAAALQSTGRALRARADEVPERVVALQEQVKKLNRELEQARRGSLSRGSALESAKVEDVSGVRVAHLILEGEDGVIDAADKLFADRLQGDGVAIVLGTAALAVKVGGGALHAGLDAGKLANTGAEATGAKGGGRPESARGGVKDPSKRSDALNQILDLVRGAVGSG